MRNLEIGKVAEWAAATLFMAADASGYEWTQEQIHVHATEIVNSFPERVRQPEIRNFIKAVINRARKIMNGDIRP